MVKEKVFGKMPDGRPVTLYSISNDKGMQADVMNYGAILVNLFAPDKEGKTVDVNLGYDDLDAYFDNGNFFGAFVGPIANRTADARFVLDGVTYELDVNDGKNNLHTHFDKAFHKQYFEADVDEAANSVTFKLSMEDGELGLPGNREFAVTYMVTNDNGLRIDYDAKTDRKTIYNPTNHSYFNLKGHDNGSVLDEVLWLGCSKYTEIVKGAIPTGKLADVAGTPLDFTTPKAIGDRVESDFAQMVLVGGYDHNFVIDGNPGELRKAAVLSDEETGRTMEVYTDMPGIQVYSANCVGEHTGKGGAQYKKRCGIALETQYFPNSANDPNFAKPVVEPEKPFHSTTIYKFV